jgi:hypothetical protein
MKSKLILSLLCLFFTFSITSVFGKSPLQQTKLPIKTDSTTEKKFQTNDSIVKKKITRVEKAGNTTPTTKKTSEK